MNNPKILVVDDEQTLRAALFRIFSRRNYQVITTGNVKEAESVITTNSELELAIVDVKLPDGDGIELLSTLKQKYNNIPVIVLTGFASIDVAVKATKMGAYHFMTKPFNIEELVSIAEKALSHKKLVFENTELKSQLQSRYRFDNIIGQSDPIQNVLSMIEKVADTDSTILVTGESGTGKELVAKAIHYNSSRNNKAFIPINCGAIPSELLESELFGHVKGAFTGAISNRQGRFELANKGTLFLDEIGDLSPNLQVKLLRVLQEKRFEPVGSAKTIESDVRIIAATNADLTKAVKEGRFREDLYYRLNVIPIKIPSLRERKDDIPLLLEHFIKHFNATKGNQIRGIHPITMDKLINYNWPGNIRELENFVERVSILKKDGIIENADLPVHFNEHQTHKYFNHLPTDIPDAGIDFNSAISAYENQLIINALNKTGWNRNQAAILLRLNRTTLVEKIKKKGLTPEATL
ncbi:MAG: sigma-54-dependent Fis family transcriptional regulator [Bdellovibrionales bacterium]|nr:sigma-54 dependent transcriptional regulator [Bdellovibrionales bacterium]NQZ18070.1 sigma-54-dependent Fis family transcriptional regulator [Bdellovibrionales bacterium]